MLLFKELLNEKKWITPIKDKNHYHYKIMVINSLFLFEKSNLQLFGNLNVIDDYMKDIDFNSYLHDIDIISLIFSMYSFKKHNFFQYPEIIQIDCFHIYFFKLLKI